MELAVVVVGSCGLERVAERVARLQCARLETAAGWLLRGRMRSGVVVRPGDGVANLDLGGGGIELEALDVNCRRSGGHCCRVSRCLGRTCAGGAFGQIDRHGGRSVAIVMQGRDTRVARAVQFAETDGQIGRAHHDSTDVAARDVVPDVLGGFMNVDGMATGNDVGQRGGHGGDAPFHGIVTRPHGLSCHWRAVHHDLIADVAEREDHISQFGARPRMDVSRMRFTVLCERSSLCDDHASDKHQQGKR